MALKTGEKYLTIQLLNSIKVSAFPNQNKKNETHPDFKGDGVAVWVNVKKDAEPNKVATSII